MDIPVILTVIRNHNHRVFPVFPSHHNPVFPILLALDLCRLSVMARDPLAHAVLALRAEQALRVTRVPRDERARRVEPVLLDRLDRLAR